MSIKNDFREGVSFVTKLTLVFFLIADLSLRCQKWVKREGDVKNFSFFVLKSFCSYSGYFGAFSEKN